MRTQQPAKYTREELSVYHDRARVHKAPNAHAPARSEYGRGQARRERARERSAQLRARGAHEVVVPDVHLVQRVGHLDWQKRVIALPPRTHCTPRCTL